MLKDVLGHHMLTFPGNGSSTFVVNDPPSIMKWRISNIPIKFNESYKIIFCNNKFLNYSHWVVTYRAKVGITQIPFRKL